MIARNESPSPGQVGKVKTADQSRTSSTALTDETHLQSTIGPNETWIFTWLLSCVFSAVGQLKVAVVVPSGATLLAVAEMHPNGIVPAFGVATASGTGIPLVSALSTSGVVRVTATVANGSTAGTVKLQIAQNTSDGTATTVQANSNLVAVKV